VSIGVRISLLAVASTIECVPLLLEYNLVTLSGRSQTSASIPVRLSSLAFESTFESVGLLWEASIAAGLF